MIKNETLKKILPSSILLNPIGKNGNEIWIEDFEQLYPLFFKSVLEIQKADISEFSGFGEFSEDGIPEFSTFKDFLVKSFDDSNDDYWKNWKELFNTSMMKKEFFEKYFNKMIKLSSFCENQRFLVNNNLFFGSRGYAGEFGLINVDNKPIDEFVSLRALTKIVKEKLHLNINNSELIELYKTNKDVKAIVLNSTKYLAKAIIQMIQVYDLDYYILNGRVIDFGEEYLEYIRKPIEEYNKDAKIVFSTLREEAIILGAKEIGSEFVLDHALKGLENYEKK